MGLIFIPAKDGRPDPDNARVIGRDAAGNLTIDGQEVPVIGTVGENGDITYDHPEVEPEGIQGQSNPS
jgi:hypothetical protein